MNGVINSAVCDWQDGPGVDVDGLMATLQGSFMNQRPFSVDTQLDNTVCIQKAVSYKYAGVSNKVC